MGFIKLFGELDARCLTPVSSADGGIIITNRKRAHFGWVDGSLAMTAPAHLVLPSLFYFTLL